jgi:mannose-6-phosphate isomerase-like protein (cupin superfamily)
MIRKSKEKDVLQKENHLGGSGRLTIRNLLNGDGEMYGKGRAFCHTTLEPGSSIGYHMHNGESETYYIVSGSGEYNDNGTIVPVYTGDVAHTPPGEGHGLHNTGTEPLEFIALILYD